MRGLNKVIMIGRLGREPEIRASRESGAKWGTFSLATNRSIRVGDSWEEATDWHRVKCFGKLAERCALYLSKGSLVAVEGAVHSEQWTDDDGQRRYSTSIVADSVTFLEPMQPKVEERSQIEA